MAESQAFESIVLTLMPALSIVLTVVTTYFSFYIYSLYRDVTPGWKTVAIALAIMTIFALAFLAVDIRALPPDALRAAIAMYFLLTSSVLFFGFWQMKKTFEENELVEKETIDRIRYFEAGVKSRSAKKK